MKLKENGARIVGLVIDYVNGEIDRWEFDLDYPVMSWTIFRRLRENIPDLPDGLQIPLSGLTPTALGCRMISSVMRWQMHWLGCKR